MAPIGASLAFLVLITGAIWENQLGHLVGLGRKININIGSADAISRNYCAAQRAEEKGNDGRPCAVLALVGLVNLPIHKILRRLVVHPASTSKLYIDRKT